VGRVTRRGLGRTLLLQAAMRADPDTASDRVAPGRAGGRGRRRRRRVPAVLAYLQA
jgi:hypothetical protein